ncbi:MAG: MDR family MFS transporter, partial [Propionicimonas sp.]|nr:MDR family MFS transporter [Propionicimonas sp.]
MAAVVTAERPALPQESPEPIMGHRQIMFVIYALMAGMFLSSLDQTIVGTAIRTIGDDLHGLDQQAWVTTAYLIAATVTTPLYGKLSDVFGRRPLFILSISIFVAGSLLSSFATSMLTLAAFRAVQGLGAGGLMSLPLAIMGDMLAPRERAKYQGYFLATFGVAAVIGPLVGGVFAGADQLLGIAGWRWVFLVNVPVGIAALAMVVAFLHLPHLTHGRPRVDWWGAGLVVATLAPLLLVAEQGREWGWTSPAAIACYVIGAVSLLGFILVERAMGPDAIIPLRLFGSRPFSMATVLSVLVGFGMFGAMLTLPLYLQIVMGLSPTQSGFATLPMMLGVMLSSVGTGQIVSRTGKYAAFPITGTATTALGFLVLTGLTPDKPYLYLAAAMFVVGLGLGQLMQTLTMAVQAASSARDIGVATSSATFFRQIGGTLGTAIMLSLLFSVLPTNITTSLSNQDTLTAALDAALDPAVAAAPENRQIMATMGFRT